MLIIEGRTIKLTRGDIASFEITAENEDKTAYVFQPNDVVRMTVNEKNNMENVVMQKDVVASEECESVTISLTHIDTKIGEIINKPTDYWYEVVVNPDTAPKTIIGYDDEEGPAIFKLLPEGDSK